MSSANIGAASPQFPTCKRGSGFSSFETTTNTRPVIAPAWAVAGKVTSNFTVPDGDPCAAVIDAATNKNAAHSRATEPVRIHILIYYSLRQANSLGRISC